MTRAAMTRLPDSRILCALLAASLLSGCAQLAPLFERGPERDHKRAVKREAQLDHQRAVQREAARSEERAESRAAELQRDQTALREGIRLYNEGDFNGAIRRLNEVGADSPVRTRVTALKYTAFSYCVTSRPKLCEQAFEKAFRLDPEFALEPGEQGHPLWGPAYVRAKRE